MFRRFARPCSKVKLAVRHFSEESSSSGNKKLNPFRRPIPWKSDEFYDKAALDHELRRVFDVCHGCRRCFNLCNSFPRLFDLIDKSKTGELDSVDSSSFKPVVDDCTLCDMCATTKCPYVPPHEFNIDFPHLMLRYRAVENEEHNRKGISAEEKSQKNDNAYGATSSSVDSRVHVLPETSRTLDFQPAGILDKLLTATDTNGTVASYVAPVVNAAMHNPVLRTVGEKIADVHKDAALPPFASKSDVFMNTLDELNAKYPCNEAAPAFASHRKVLLYATCLVNFNYPGIGTAAYAVLQHNGVRVAASYPGCCGMPSLERGDVRGVSENAQKLSRELEKFVDEGYTIVTLTPSCGLMFKQEWPLLVPEDPVVKKVSAATRDICEYIVDVGKKEGIVKDGLKPLGTGVTLHFACHARAQNMGNKALEMLKLVPEAKVGVVDKCSGHGGTWGCKKQHWETALKVGAPVTKRAVKGASEQSKIVSSECALAGLHIAQSMEIADKDAAAKAILNKHPVELLAASYGFAQLQ
jgi:glycerol-3-phosphate dehydrogenase subunit C